MILRRHQAGVSLIEVLISLLILGIGMLGAAALQMNALKFTDSSTASSQASFIAYDMMDRIRANPDANYKLASLAAAPSSGSLTTPVTQDLSDFVRNVTAMGGTNASKIEVVGRVVTITIVWNDARAAGARAVDNTASTASTTQTYKLVSRVAINTGST
jgi:type IV pilus assembly protein PilV